MRDDDCGHVVRPNELVNRRLHNLLALRVQGAGGLVQEQDLGTVDEGARDGDALLLPARETVPAVTHLGVVSLRQLHDEVMGVRHGGRPLHVFAGGVGGAVEDVLLHRSRKQHRLLPHQADVLAQPAHAELFQRNAVQGDLPLLGVVEALHQLDRRGLAGARRPNQRNGGARLHHKVVPATHRDLRAGGVPEVHVVELDLPSRAGDFDAVVGGGVDLGLTVNHLKDGLERRLRLGLVSHGAHGLAQPEGRHQQDHDHHQHVPEAELVGIHKQPPDVEEQAVNGHHSELRVPARQGAHDSRFEVARLVVRQPLLVQLHQPLLQRQRRHRADAHDRLGNHLPRLAHVRRVATGALHDHELDDAGNHHEGHSAE
mmetsp:Transcript_47370/g.88270  ORF Transcript_47370/g.88270 Transcript_47370/m.88270 type:complete len:371 (-) Transcript_47370:394-1506(-)